jgi:hypothetical protein
MKTKRVVLRREKLLVISFQLRELTGAAKGERGAIFETCTIIDSNLNLSTIDFIFRTKLSERTLNAVDLWNWMTRTNVCVLSGAHELQRDLR